MSKLLKNEQIKASEVSLKGLQGEDLGVMPTSEALALAKQHKVDLVCESLMQSPPLCRLMGAAAAKLQTQQARKQEQKEASRGQSAPQKVKELRLTPHIEEHDYETKRQQAERMLAGGNSVLFTVKVQGKEGAMGKQLVERFIQDLKGKGRPKTGIQVSGKQVLVQLDPS